MSQSDHRAKKTSDEVKRVVHRTVDASVKIVKTIPNKKLTP
ncbi:MAG TPA: hypothetical protein VFK27_07075 [Bacillales bacterium]|nr:hypothetical protein [Bacillales bacterium]